MLDESLEVALLLARDAAKAVARVYERAFTVETKADGSPITDADRAANEAILRGLHRYFPSDAVLSEETPFDPDAPLGRRLWMVDPLDGTADFAGRTGDFAVMIGLCIAGQPALGVVMAPVLDRLWAGGRGLPAFEIHGGDRRPLEAAPPVPDAPLRVLVSRKHRPPAVDRLIDAVGHATAMPRGSVGVKIGLLAAGEADVYLHPSRGTHLWDTCAPQAILEAAGGRLTDAFGEPLSYDPGQTSNLRGILAGHPVIHETVRAIVADHLPAELRAGRS